MRYVPRAIESSLRSASRSFAAVVLTGPRRSGKTWLLKRMFPRAEYYLLEDPEIVARLRADPRGFMEEVKPPAILDEVQNVPEIFQWVRARIDSNPSRFGQWLLTGSQESPMMRGVAESMAGRAAIMQLLPFSRAESNRVSVLHGGYPEVLARPKGSEMWFSSYVQTYLERDVRAITAVRDLSVFRRFLAIVASRHGQVLNKTDLASPLGVSVPTITQWLGVLETTSQIFLVPPYFENFGKRLVKSPKLYLADAGLACHLLGIGTINELAKSPFLGSIFEGLIASEIVKAQLNRGARRELYYFRDEQGLEVDFLVPGRSSGLHLVECKAGRTATPDMARPMLRLAEALHKNTTGPRLLSMTLVHSAASSELDALRTLAPGVKAVSFSESFARLLR